MTPSCVQMCDKTKPERGVRVRGRGGESCLYECNARMIVPKPLWGSRNLHGAWRVSGFAGTSCGCQRAAPKDAFSPAWEITPICPCSGRDNLIGNRPPAPRVPPSGSAREKGFKQKEERTSKKSYRLKKEEGRKVLQLSTAPPVWRRDIGVRTFHARAPCPLPSCGGEWLLT